MFRALAWSEHFSSIFKDIHRDAAKEGVRGWGATLPFLKSENNARILGEKGSLCPLLAQIFYSK